ncbi:MAG TPA: ATP-binding protein, partial [Terriglobales bacterium]|nr:ATP-binding protein [Terriglobales bacterium]
MSVYILIFILVMLLWLLRNYLYSLLSFLSLRLEGKEPDFQILNSLRDDLIHERKKKIASLEMILSTWEKGESISTHLKYFKDLIHQLRMILKNQRENLLIISPNPFLWVKLKSQVSKIEKNKLEIQEIKKRLSIFSDEIEGILEKATQKFTFSLNEVIKESVKIVRTEKTQILKERDIKIEERYEEIGERFRLPYKSYREWQKLISNLVRNSVEAVEQKLLSPGSLLQAGLVGVSVKGLGEEVSVAVQDNGIGMDEKTRETFYKRGFTQGKEAGLGLGITEETIEFVNKYGSWNIESKINEGTRIEIRINKEKAKEQDLKIEDRSALVIKLKSRRVMFALAGVLVVAIG